MSEPVFTVHAEDPPSWAEVVRHAEHGESVRVIAHGEHVADIVPSGERDRLRKTIEVLSDTELVQDLREVWPMHALDEYSPPSKSPLTWPTADSLASEWGTTGVTNPQVRTTICDWNCNQKGPACRTQLRNTCS